MKKDFKKYIEQNNHFFSESHLYGYFNNQYRGNTIDEVTFKLKTIHDTSCEIENCESELGRELSDKERTKLEERFNKAVLENLETKNDVVIGFINSCDEYCDEGY